VGRSPISRLIKVRVNDRFYYVKTYISGGKRLRRFIGRSRARAEWENLMFFGKLGIPTAKLVAYGQEMRWGIFMRGSLVTEELKETRDLAALAREQSPYLNDRNWVRQVGRQLADYTKRLHNKGFVHTDLKWRNLLVSHGDEPRLFFIDCPQGRKRVGYFFGRGVIKDLACLDRVAKNQLTRTERLWFFKAYCGHSKLSKADKKLIRKVLSFFSGRE
jgi:tRNA A-37 threonylcarbamoyl transferase component Bud32